MFTAVFTIISVTASACSAAFAVLFVSISIISLQCACAENTKYQCAYYYYKFFHDNLHVLLKFSKTVWFKFFIFIIDLS